MTVVTDEVNTRITRLAARRQEASAQLGHLSLLAIARLARSVQPHAATVRLTWSDDNRHLVVTGCFTADGARIGYTADGTWTGEAPWLGSWEQRFLNATTLYTGHLDDTNQSAWEPFTSPSDDTSDGPAWWMLHLGEVIARLGHLDTTACTETFAQWARTAGITPEDLDATVHDQANRRAADINNGGLDAQIEYLLDVCGPAETRQLLTDCDPAAPTPLYDLSDLRGCMHDGYDERQVNHVLGRISDAAGLRLVCVWDYVDEYGPGGNSDFFIEDDGRLFELAGDLWPWLNGDPDDPATPHFPRPFESWRGPVTHLVVENLLSDDRHNYAHRRR